MSQMDTMSPNENNSNEAENSNTSEHFSEVIQPENFDSKQVDGDIELEEDGFAQTEALIDEEMQSQASIQVDSSSHHEGEGENKKDDEKKRNEAFDNFLATLEKQSDPEIKLQMTIDFMGASISQTGTPNFKNFWEARKHCLILFKDNIAPTNRTALWNRYVELSKEARSLKDILDEQSAFAVEQIDIAIQALENDINQFNEIFEKTPHLEFPAVSHTLEPKFDFYDKIQRELNILNTHASRINGLRKELIKTEMRVRQKNKFFHRLSLTGDKVFPKRKDLIKEISQQFIADVDQFINENFDKDSQMSLFTCREEIKSLQSIAKILTLNTQSFTHTRTRLSECWDKIKQEEKERKKERLKQKGLFKHNVDLVMQKIMEFNQAFEQGSLSIADANQKIEDVVSTMRSVELGRDELGYLRTELNKSRKLVLDKVKIEEQSRLTHEQEKVRQKREKITQLKQRIDQLFVNIEHFDAEKLSEERDAIVQAIQESSSSRPEKQDLERLLKPLKDIITDKKEKALLNLSADDQENLQQLKSVLKQRKERRQESKLQLEAYRKDSGTSGFDFEKAMNYNNLVNTEKERLDKIDQGIKEIENKISEIERKRKK